MKKLYSQTGNSANIEKTNNIDYSEVKANRDNYLPAGDVTVDTDSVNVQNLHGVGRVSNNGAIATSCPRELGSLSSKRVMHEFNTRFPSYDDALALSGGATSLFPQALEMLGNRIYMAYGGTVSMWIVVYDAATLEELTCFFVSESFGEGIAVYEDGASTFLVCRNLTSGVDRVGKFDVTTLPANLSSPTPVQVLNEDPGSFVFTDGNYIYMQNQYNKGGINRRNKFSVYEKDFTFVCYKVFNEREIGSVDADSLQPKVQNVNVVNGQFYATYGSLYESGDITKNHLQVGMRVFSDMCSEVDCFMIEGDSFISTLSSNGYDVDFIEYEGICEYNGVPISLLVTKGPDAAGGGGLLLIEERSPSGIDFSKSRSLMGDATDNLFGGGRIEQDDDGIKNPATGNLLASTVELMDWMYNTGTSVAELYTSGSTITDADGATLPQGVFVEIKTGNSFSFEMTVRGSTSASGYWITRNGAGNYTQTPRA